MVVDKSQNHNIWYESLKGSIRIKSEIAPVAGWQTEPVPGIPEHYSPKEQHIHCRN